MARALGSKLDGDAAPESHIIEAACKHLCGGSRDLLPVTLAMAAHFPSREQRSGVTDNPSEVSPCHHELRGPSGIPLIASPSQETNSIESAREYNCTKWVPHRLSDEAVKNFSSPDGGGESLVCASATVTAMLVSASTVQWSILRGGERKVRVTNLLLPRPTT